MCPSTQSWMVLLGCSCGALLTKPLCDNIKCKQPGACCCAEGGHARSAATLLAVLSTGGRQPPPSPRSAPASTRMYVRTPDRPVVRQLRLGHQVQVPPAVVLALGCDGLLRQLGPTATLLERVGWAGLACGPAGGARAQISAAATAIDAPMGVACMRIGVVCTHAGQPGTPTFCCCCCLGCLGCLGGFWLPSAAPGCCAGAVAVAAADAASAALRLGHSLPGPLLCVRRATAATAACGCGAALAPPDSAAWR